MSADLVMDWSPSTPKPPKTDSYRAIGAVVLGTRKYQHDRPMWSCFRTQDMHYRTTRTEHAAKR